jgi:hypothetical protein
MSDLTTAEIRAILAEPHLKLDAEPTYFGKTDEAGVIHR